MILGNLKTIDGKTISIISKVYYDKKLGKDLEGRLVIPGFVDSHAHIDSNFLLDVCEPGIVENMPANLAILDAKSPIDAVRKLSPNRLVISNGKLVHSGGISL
ncbi:amidohydrolase family protein [Acidianus ambivalens]|uniref:Amidohydrolase family protein n=1 Tax=Acidianus ambivalens TaxID=2283 RepID=A0A650CXG1_ACIAM|nr:amidohydrolase family protein [Acidianus ambivalens]MQL54320.1 amidohydrolase family protein [Acidianus ambivalens]QGR22147.1 amidohydrolase family protein [Acidianus ambivalens]